jgi:hypothetical protein
LSSAIKVTFFGRKYSDDAVVSVLKIKLNFEHILDLHFILSSSAYSAIFESRQWDQNKEEKIILSGRENKIKESKLIEC